MRSATRTIPRSFHRASSLGRSSGARILTSGTTNADRMTNGARRSLPLAAPDMWRLFICDTIDSPAHKSHDGRSRAVVDCEHGKLPVNRTSGKRPYRQRPGRCRQRWGTFLVWTPCPESMIRNTRHDVMCGVQCISTFKPVESRGGVLLGNYLFGYYAPVGPATGRDRSAAAGTASWRKS